MARRKRYMFTNKEKSRRGMISSVFGCFALASVSLAVYLCFKNGGEGSPKYGLGAFLSFIFASIGFSFGARACSEEDTFMISPIFGITTNLIAVLIAFAILFLGVY